MLSESTNMTVTNADIMVIDGQGKRVRLNRTNVSFDLGQTISTSRDV